MTTSDALTPLDVRNEIDELALAGIQQATADESKMANRLKDAILKLEPAGQRAVFMLALLLATSEYLTVSLHHVEGPTP